MLQNAFRIDPDIIELFRIYMRDLGSEVLYLRPVDVLHSPVLVKMDLNWSDVSNMGKNNNNLHIYLRFEFFS
jgi:hypothetical protein